MLSGQAIERCGRSGIQNHFFLVNIFLESSYYGMSILDYDVMTPVLVLPPSDWRLGTFLQMAISAISALVVPFVILGAIRGSPSMHRKCKYIKQAELHLLPKTKPLELHVAHAYTVVLC